MTSDLELKNRDGEPALRFRHVHPLPGPNADRVCLEISTHSEGGAPVRVGPVPSSVLLDSGQQPLTAFHR